MENCHVAGTNPTSAGARLGRSLFTVLGVLVVLSVVWTFGALSFSYSDGERAGLLQKFSRKGWICKTYEGELALYVVAGVAPEIWHFSVRDEALAKQLSAAVGQRTQLHYAEHRGIPTSCFGETDYFVDRVNTIGDGPPAVAAPVP
jgi:hypothetical protein